MPTVGQWRSDDRDRADADLLHRAATWLREHPDRAGYAGVTDDHDVHALAVLLDTLAVYIVGLDWAVRLQAVESCRVLLREYSGLRAVPPSHGLAGQESRS